MKKRSFITVTDQFCGAGGSREQIKQYGNAVTPPAMELLMQRCMEALR